MARRNGFIARAHGREIIRLAARQLGSMALADWCARCFWYRLQVRHKLPFQIFPGIFSSIDSYTKRVVHHWFDVHKCAPPWLEELGVAGYIATPHWSHFKWVFEPYGVEVAGTPDDFLLCRDESLKIPDYKTAKHTPTQDVLLPEYQVQLNAYAQIAANLGYPRVSGLALVYLEPVCDCDNYCVHCSERGFDMEFHAHIVSIERRSEMLDPLFERAREIYEKTEPPEGRLGCQDCRRLDDLMNAGGNGSE